MKSTILGLLLTSCLQAQPLPQHNLTPDPLPGRWDEALPLGNALLGCLVWQHEGRLRLSLDRADLWDLRPMKGLVRPEFTYQWVAQKVAENDYPTVQQYFDAPYEYEAGPSKLPGAALEFDTPAAGKSELDISTGLATVHFAGNLLFQTFVHADRREGWFRFQGDSAALARLIPALIPPAYAGKNASAGLARLGYPEAPVFMDKDILVFHQPCWGGFSYETAVGIKKNKDGSIEGVWSISSHFPQKPWLGRAVVTVRKALKRGFGASFESSRKWWTRYWAQSSVRLPDPVLERQYYLDQYKFGCVARANAPMISLQGIWTADNGNLPPWKGDFHHDLNTELSYWPAYAANHLDEAQGYLNHLESNYAAHKAYTRQYFGTPGLNIPGVETLLGEPMGGWIQYSCSPTTVAWLARHFYLQWRYGRDRNFLKEHAYPFLLEAAEHLEAVTTLNPSGVRVLPLSSSPEINNNSIKAWFPKTLTNFDLALIQFVFEKTAELAEELGDKPAAEHWRKVGGELPAFALTEKIAPGLDVCESHRHFSHLLAIYPLGLIDWHAGAAQRKIIRNSLKTLDSLGTTEWNGYSFAWLANLRAEAHDGSGARDALRIFAEAFVSANSFHLNGDQTARGYAGSHDRPFTLEGNFASAAGVQEMLMQSHGGVVEVFPAIPAEWLDVSFHHLRAEGAFLVSAVCKNGQTSTIEIEAEKGGLLRLRLPVKEMRLEPASTGVRELQMEGEIRQFNMGKKGRLILSL